MLRFFRRRSHQYAASGDGPEHLPSTSAPLPSVAPANASCVVAAKPLRLRTAASYLPHPDKVHYGGEDAYFISDYGGGVIGVADGVGGWQESGVNPADYSRTLMQLARAYLEGTDMFSESASSRQGLIDPKGALHAAHMNTKVPGSATACILQLDQANSSLVAANLGDSGFAVFRDRAELIRSKPLQHYFDCPLQFGAFPEFVEATDTADMADMYNIALRPGDIIVAGTDGLWDNCYVSEIITLLPKTPSEVQAAADAISAAARKHAGDAEYASPYTREALSQGFDLPWWDKLLGMSFKGGKLHLKQLAGGKMDDITVIVSLVDAVDEEPPAAPSQQQEPVADGRATEELS